MFVARRGTVRMLPAGTAPASDTIRTLNTPVLGGTHGGAPAGGGGAGGGAQDLSCGIIAFPTRYCIPASYADRMKFGLFNPDMFGVTIASCSTVRFSRSA